jgi:hypothetical protein
MNKLYRICISLAPVFLFICAISISAQWNKKPYTEWSEKEATKLLNDSPWGQTQVFSDTSNEFGTGVGRAGAGTSDNRSGDYSAHHLNIRIRFLSAKPIRQAFSRVILLGQKGQVPDQLAAQLNAFATQDFPDYIVVSVDCDTNESKNELREFKTLLDTRSMVDLKNDTYLSAKGQRTFIASFQPPKKDGLGAKFIFPRTVDGKPAIPPDSDEIQFHSEFSNKYKLNMRFKTKDMMVDGKLEY